MNHNEQVLQREHNRFLYLEEYPTPEQAPTAYEDAEQQIVYYTNDYISDHDELPNIDDTFDRFNLKTDSDYEALEKFLERERSLTEWGESSQK